jgi:hypothetical protein
MPVRTFVDTNILLYAHDVDAGEKHERAKHALEELWAERSGVLVPQVLQEFYVNVTRKLLKPLARKRARKTPGHVPSVVYRYLSRRGDVCMPHRRGSADQLLGCVDMRFGSEGRRGTYLLRGSQHWAEHRRSTHREPACFTGRLVRLSNRNFSPAPIVFDCSESPARIRLIRSRYIPDFTLLLMSPSPMLGGPTVRNAARIKLGYYPLPTAEGSRLRSLLVFPPGASALDPCAGTGAAVHQLTAGADVAKYGVELDAERAAIAAASGIATVHGNLFDTDSRVESFSFLYLNPPYDSEIGSMGNKRMEYLFLEHTFRWLVESGVLLMVVPQELPADRPGVGALRPGRSDGCTQARAGRAL